MGPTSVKYPVYGSYCVKYPSFIGPNICPSFMGPTLRDVPVYVSRCMKCPSLWVTLYEMSLFMGFTA